jgi:replicative DNA helicase
MSNWTVPPHSLEAEQAVIAAVMSSPSCFVEVEYLQPEDFFRHDHQVLWRAIRANPEARDTVGLMTSVQDADLRAYVVDLARGFASAANVAVYGTVVKERAILRRLMAECMAVMGSIKDNAKPADVIAGAVRRFEQLGQGAVVGAGPRHVFDLAPAWMDDFRQRAHSHGMVGLSTGFLNLDRRWQGMRPGQMIVVAGRPKTGKSTLALNIAEHVARTKPVAVFQMEMSAGEMIDRSVASHGRVDIGAIRDGSALEEFGDNVTVAFSALKSSNLYIDASPRQTMDYIRMHAKAFVRKHGEGLLVVDYLGLIRSDSRSSTRNDEVAEISRDLKLLAKETNCPVMVLAQMNRNVEREKRKPQLSDLRDSGAIEQDADVICFTHKEDQEQQYSEIITRAMRSGQPGTDHLLCRFNMARFETPSDDWTPPTAEDRQQRQQPRFTKGAK